MPWRLVLAVVGIVLAAIMLFSFAVGFSSSTAATPSTVTHTQVVGTPDSIDRAGVTPSTDPDLARCQSNPSC
jgi:hypothetical protein